MCCAQQNVTCSSTFALPCVRAALTKVKLQLESSPGRQASVAPLTHSGIPFFFVTLQQEPAFPYLVVLHALHGQLVAMNPQGIPKDGDPIAFLQLESLSP